MKKQNKKAIELDMLGWFILGVVVLVIVIAALILFKDKAIAAIDYIKNIFRFGR